MTTLEEGEDMLLKYRETIIVQCQNATKATVLKDHLLTMSD
jgi:hypothetical protein